MVLDLIHPSLYPYVHRRSPRFFEAAREPIDNGDVNQSLSVVLDLLREQRDPIKPSSPIDSLKFCGAGQSSCSAGGDYYDLTWGKQSRYQWLPVDVSVSPSHQLTFLSYINNLHPDPSTPSGVLYPIINRVLAKFIPLFERTLTDTRRERLATTVLLGSRPEFAPEKKWECFFDLEKPQSSGSYKDEEEHNRYLKEMGEYYEKRKFVRPIIEPFVPPSVAGKNQVILNGRTVQVIVKLANIQLTPEKPIYEGGTWHVEGTNNEHIVATGIYYFESHNISDPLLSFRQSVIEPTYEQWEHQHLEGLYGIRNDMSHNQFLGTIKTPQGRCICFPNGLQHRLSEFKLVDPTKSGHRKMLVFFFIDPNRRILSTSDVPPQQTDWYLLEVRNCVAGTRLATLPVELLDEIFSYLANAAGPFMMLEEAKEHRQCLMRERSEMSSSVSDMLYEQTFNLCEH